MRRTGAAAGRFVGAGLGQKGQKLLSAIARQKVRPANRAPQPLGKLAQHGITRRMAVAIIHRLEVVKIGKDQRKAQLVELKYFGGLRIDEIAESLATSPATVKREWQFARSWLYREMERYND